MKYRSCLNQWFVFLAAWTLAIACSADAPVVPNLSGLHLVAASPTEFEATVAKVVEPTPSVIVLDNHGKPVSGIRVTFTFDKAEDGRIETSGSISDLHGLSSAPRWIPGTRAGLETLTASIAQSNDVVAFHAHVLADSAVQLVGLWSSAATTAGPGDTVALALTLGDRFRNEVRLPGVRVRFVITKGDGSLSSNEVVTDEHGVAATKWFLPSALGLNSLVAYSADYWERYYSVEVIDPQHTRVYDLVQIGAAPPLQRFTEGGFVALTDDGRFVDTYVGFSEYEEFGVWRSSGRYGPSPSNKADLILSADSSHTQTATLSGDDLFLQRVEPGSYLLVAWRYKERK